MTGYVLTAEAVEAAAKERCLIEWGFGAWVEMQEHGRARYRKESERELRAAVPEIERSIREGIASALERERYDFHSLGVDLLLDRVKNIVTGVS